MAFIKLVNTLAAVVYMTNGGQVTRATLDLLLVHAGAMEVTHQLANNKLLLSLDICLSILGNERPYKEPAKSYMYGVCYKCYIIIII